jgi:uncharacterized protein (TIGR02588 family)
MVSGSGESILQRTAVVEWIAAALGFVMTLAVLGYAVLEGLEGEEAPPALSVTAGAATRTGHGFIAPVTVSNASKATAAAVEVSGRLEIAGRPVEERRATFAYVPGEGQATGGLVFEGDPRAGRLTLRAEGYEEP